MVYNDTFITLMLFTVSYIRLIVSHFFFSHIFLQVEILVSLWNVSVVSIVSACLGYSPNAHEYPNSLRSSKNTQYSQDLYRYSDVVQKLVHVWDELIESLKLVL
jgi:hypothetical protein